MQELRAAAKAHYYNDPDFSQAIREISRRIDREFGNAVNYQAFVTLVQERSRRCTSDALFRKLDRGGKGHLDQDDLRVLYYLMDTRGDCSHCRDVLRSVYYTCLPCFDNCRSPNSPSFLVCCACYRAKSFDHPQHVDFVDNYELLQMRRSRRLNWGELPRSVPQDVAANLIVKGIEAACHEGEKIGLPQGQTDMPDDHLDQATDVASDAPAPDLNTDSVLQSHTAAWHGLREGEKIGLPLGQTDIPDDHLDQATEVASDALAPDLDTDSVLQSLTAAWHGLREDVTDWIHDFLV